MKIQTDYLNQEKNQFKYFKMLHLYCIKRYNKQPLKNFSAPYLDIFRKYISSNKE